MQNENLPPIMANAKMDLTATVEGYFSSEDWAQILTRAERQWRENLQRPGLTEQKAWEEVIRDFMATRYWGFVPGKKREVTKKPPANMGLQLIWLAFNALTIGKVAVLWFGQIYTRSDEPQDKWKFFLVLGLVVGNYLYFLWRHRSYSE